SIDVLGHGQPLSEFVGDVATLAATRAATRARILAGEYTRKPGRAELVATRTTPGVRGHAVRARMARLSVAVFAPSLEHVSTDVCKRACSGARSPLTIGGRFLEPAVERDAVDVAILARAAGLAVLP